MNVGVMMIMFCFSLFFGSLVCLSVRVGTRKSAKSCHFGKKIKGWHRKICQKLGILARIVRGGTGKYENPGEQTPKK